MKQEQRKAFEEYLTRKQPIVQDYQYADDFIRDSMSYFLLIRKIGNVYSNFLDKRVHRLSYAEIAEACGLPYRDKWYKLEIEKEREDGI